MKRFTHKSLSPPSSTDLAPNSPLWDRDDNVGVARHRPRSRSSSFHRHRSRENAINSRQHQSDPQNQTSHPSPLSTILIRTRTVPEGCPCRRKTEPMSHGR